MKVEQSSSQSNEYRKEHVDLHQEPSAEGSVRYRTKGCYQSTGSGKCWRTCYNYYVELNRRFIGNMCRGMEGFRGPDNTSGFASNNINNNGETVQKDDKLHILF